MSEETEESAQGESEKIYSEDFLPWLWNSDDPAAQQARASIAQSENHAARQEMTRQGYKI